MSKDLPIIKLGTFKNQRNFAEILYHSPLIIPMHYIC